MFSLFVDGLSVCSPNLLMVYQHVPSFFDGLWLFSTFIWWFIMMSPKAGGWFQIHTSVALHHACCITCRSLPGIGEPQVWTQVDWVVPNNNGSSINNSFSSMCSQQSWQTQRFLHDFSTGMISNQDANVTYKFGGLANFHWFEWHFKRKWMVKRFLDVHITIAEKEQHMDHFNPWMQTWTCEIPFPQLTYIIIYIYI